MRVLRAVCGMLGIPCVLVLAAGYFIWTWSPFWILALVVLLAITTTVGNYKYTRKVQTARRTLAAGKERGMVVAFTGEVFRHFSAGFNAAGGNLQHVLESPFLRPLIATFLSPCVVNSAWIGKLNDSALSNEERQNNLQHQELQAYRAGYNCYNAYMAWSQLAWDCRFLVC